MNLHFKYFVVTDKSSLPDSYRKGDSLDNGSRMKCLDGKQSVLEYIVNIGKDPKDPRIVKRVFSVDEMGNVIFFEVVFNGKLELEAIPTEGKAF